MPISNDAEVLQLLLKVAGVEDIEGATKAFRDLKENAQNTASPIDQAKTALAETSTVSDDLKVAIERAKQSLAELGQEFKAGLISESAFIEKTDVLIDVLRQKEMVLTRLNGETTGFAGLTKNIFNAERAFTALATGHGLGRVGPMLESLIGAAGGPGGIGFGIAGMAFLLEMIVPKIEKFWNSWDGSTKAAKDVEELIARVQKLQALKGDDASKAFQDYLPGEDIAGRAAGAIGASGLSAQATPFETEQIKGLEGLTLQTSAVKAETDRVKNAMNERIAKANLTLASEQVDKASKPGEAGKRAREFLKGLARGNPGAFPEGFADWLESIEETPQEREQAEADIEANDPDQQYMERRHAARDQHNAEAETFNKDLDKRKAAKAASAKESRDINTYNREVDQANGDDPASLKQAAAEKKRAAAQIDRDAEAAVRIGEQGTRAAEREHAKEAKEHTPEAMYRHAHHAQQNAIMGQVQGLNQQNIAQGGQPASPEFLHHVARGAAEQVTLGADIATAVQIAITQVQAKVAEDFRKGMMRQHQASTSFYAP